MKIITYNVNGLRSAISKGLIQWLKATDADVVCFQEIKALPEQIPSIEFHELGYELYWYPAEKKGYSGVAIFTRIKPKHIEYGCGIADYDREGRVIRVDFDDVSIINTYMPSGTSGDERQAFKYRWLDDIFLYLTELRKTIPNLIVVGDFNICHTAIDIHNPKSNANTSGFLPEERAWMSKYFESGFVDAFRSLNSEPHNYTWWSYRAGSREKNLGWRIDYITLTNEIQHRLKRAEILSKAYHSDHCPVFVELE